jgi:hypothetical protein
MNPFGFANLTIVCGHVQIVSNKFTPPTPGVVVDDEATMNKTRDISGLSGPASFLLFKTLITQKLRFLNVSQSCSLAAAGVGACTTGDIVTIGHCDTSDIARLEHEME